MPNDPVVVFSGADGQELSDQIKLGGRPFDISSSTVTFYMREADSSTLKVDGGTVVEDEPTEGKIHYDWTDDDLNTPSEYFGWWHVDTPEGEQDTEEFLVIVTQHAPGFRAPTGAIYKRLKGILPITVTALQDETRYGDAQLQNVIDEVKQTLYVSPPSVEDEASIDIRVINYAAKLSALEIIPAGVDYWLEQHQTITTGGGTTNEIASYPDRISALWKIYERLLTETREDKALIEEILGTPVTFRARTSVPEFSPGTDEGFVTPLPNDNFPDYAFPGRRTGAFRWPW